MGQRLMGYVAPSTAKSFSFAGMFGRYSRKSALVSTEKTIYRC